MKIKVLCFDCGKITKGNTKSKRFRKKLKKWTHVVYQLPDEPWKKVGPAYVKTINTKSKIICPKCTSEQ